METPNNASSIKPVSHIKAIDFCCGAGGLTRGLLDSGIEVLAGVDIDKRLKETYENNNSPSKLVCEDLKEIDIFKLKKELGITSNDLVLYGACAPCQPFSTLNRTAATDNRKTLLLIFADIVVQSPPDFIIIENVPGLNNSYGQDIFGKFLNIIAQAGFKPENVYASKLDAQYYGVPQARKRFIVLSSRHGQVLPPKRDAEESVLKDFIRKYPAIEAGQKSDEYFNHVSRPVNDKHKLILEAVPKDGGSRKDIKDTSILLPCHQRNPNVHRDVFGRMAWNKPAPTLTCRCTEIYCGRFTHPDQDRGISHREAAAIQTFPDTYKFYGAFAHVSKQIGNAVPVNLAKRLGTAIVESANSLVNRN